MEKIVYSQANLAHLIERFGLTYQRQEFLPTVSPLVPPTWLNEILEQGKRFLVVRTEKQASEWLISPVLLALNQLNDGRIGVFSGVALNVGDFIGTCDFMVTASPTPLLVQTPIIAMVEAKRQDIDLGIPQCVAEMLAAQQLNREKHEPFDELFGCVTTADNWQFMRLSGQTLQLSPRVFYLNEVGTLLGIFQWMIDRFTKINS